MRILVSGSSGLIGSALTRASREVGDEVLRLVRRPAVSADEVSWDPTHGRPPDPKIIDGIDAVVHLAGAGIGDHRWTPKYKRQLRASRVGPTSLLAQTIAALDRRPHVFLSASAIGYYGNTPDVDVDENSQPGEDFLADLVQEWEAASEAATAAQIRTVRLRSGIVLSTRGGALGKVLPMFRLGLGARLGSGKQWVSWIALPDHVAAMRFLLNADDVSGAVNLTAPNPVTNASYTKEIAASIHRPAVLAAPPFALKLVLGGFAETVLGGQRVLPSRLLSAGFNFQYPRLDSALRALIDSGS